MIVFFSNKKVAFILEWLIPILCFGYTLQVSIPFLLGINTNSFNIIARAIYLGVSLIIIFLTFFKTQNRIKLPTGAVYFILFWILYSLRLLYDLEILDLGYMDQDKYYVYSFAFGSCFVPSLAVIFNKSIISIDRLNLNTWYLLLISNIFLLLSLLYTYDGNIVLILATRAQLMINKGTLSEISIINPITVSYTGEIVAVQGICFLMLGFDKLYKLKKIIIYVGIFLGICNLILGASRGPMLAFVLLVFIIVYFRIRREPNVAVFINKLGIFLIILIVVISGYLIPKLNSQNIELESFNRLISFKESREENIKEVRDFEIASAWQQFLDNPIVGDRFTNRYDDTYPHNLILDILMSTGVIGFILFIMLYFFVIKKNNDLLVNKSYIPVFTLFISIIFSGMLSGSLFQGIAPWIFSVLILSL